MLPRWIVVYITLKGQNRWLDLGCDTRTQAFIRAYKSSMRWHWQRFRILEHPYWA